VSQLHERCRVSSALLPGSTRYLADTREQARSVKKKKRNEAKENELKARANDGWISQRERG